VGLIATRMKSYKPKNLNEVRNPITGEWVKISVVDVQKLLSMLEHVTAFIESKDGHTKY